MTVPALTPRLYWNLPKDVKILVDLLGWEPALKIVEAFGGTRLSIPSDSERNSKNRQILIELIGDEGFAILTGTMGGGLLKVPLCSMLKRERAALLYQQGQSAAQIARGLGVDENTVYRWAWSAGHNRENAPKPVQASLFNDEN